MAVRNELEQAVAMRIACATAIARIRKGHKGESFTGVRMEEIVLGQDDIGKTRLFHQAIKDYFVAIACLGSNPSIRLLDDQRLEGGVWMGVIVDKVGPLGLMVTGHTSEYYKGDRIETTLLPTRMDRIDKSLAARLHPSYEALNKYVGLVGSPSVARSLLKFTNSRRLK